MSKQEMNKSGFTLVELLLAMTLFSLTMVIVTAAFIAMNRAYTRGVIRKQIAESAQAASEDITRIIRTDGRALEKFVPCKSEPSQPSTCPTPESSWKGALCFSSARYIWNDTGLYKQQGPAGVCNASTANFSANSVTIIDPRFKVEELAVTVIPNQAGLFRVSGVIRTTDDAAFENLGDVDKSKIVCKGSSGGAAVRTCAVEKFNYIISARGAGS